MTIRVPGTTSNLGSGFDTLGLALRLYNRVTVLPRSRRGAEITSQIDGDAREGATRMVSDAARYFFRRTRKPAFGFTIAIEGEVPVARGLGSSTTVQLGLLAALNELSGAGLDRHGVFELVNVLEGHPDNAAPATFGGFTVAGPVGKSTRVLRFNVPAKARFITLIPDFEVRTADARRLLPAEYPKADLIHSLNRVALVTAALATGQLEALQGLFDDRVHQSHRTPLIPQLPKVVEAGVRAGAIGGWLSGSGSTIMCITLRNAEEVANAMLRQIPAGTVHVLHPDSSGYRIEPSPAVTSPKP
jgi:homoserine kinase